ncbi:MAG: hypothetical protein IPF70_22110 [Saprospiraceae bacterium]|nr:hypothetical protein [Saprospiraceae bacterium]
MSRRDYLDSTYGQLLCVIQGYAQRERDHMRVTWDQTRAVCYYALVAYQGTKVVPGGPTEMMPFPWDDHKGKGDRSQVTLSEDIRDQSIAKQKLMIKVRKEEQDKKKKVKK